MAAMLVLGMVIPGRPASVAAATTPPKAVLTVTPAAVIPGATAFAKGTGFAANSQVTVSVPVKLLSGTVQTLTGKATATAQGTFSVSLHVPGDAAGGKYTVTAKGGGRTATAPLVVAILKPSIVTVPTMAVPGTPITVNGFGFSAGATITLTLNGDKIGTATTGANGQFSVTVTVPASLATGTYTLTANGNGRQASIPLQVYRQIATRFYFASLYTGNGYQESLLFVNTSAIRARVTITYQLASGGPKTRTIAVPAHSRFTENVNNDLGSEVSASAVVATDVPIAAERMVFYTSDGAIDPGATQPARAWYFTNGNTTHGYREFIAIQNPLNTPSDVVVHLYPTHSHPVSVTRAMPAQSRTTIHVNDYVHDAVGIVVTASSPVVANRTEYVHSGISSKTGITAAAQRWYFASGQRSSQGGNWNRHWIGVINTTGQWSYLTLRAFGPAGVELGRVARWLRPYAREGFLMNQIAGARNVAVVVSTTQPSIAEQLTFLNYNHAGNTDTYGVTAPSTSAQFAVASTRPGQDNLLSVFNPNLVPIPVVVQFLNTKGTTTERTYVIPPFAHYIVDVGKVVPNSQLGLLVASSDPLVALDRQLIFNGNGAMTTIGTQK